MIGTKTVSFTAKVPSSVVPTIGSVAVADTNSAYATQFGSLVQGKSKAKFTITASGAYGSTITAYKTVIESKTYTGASPTTAVLTKSGSVTATITVTDSRGRTASTTKAVTVLAYSAPKITSFEAHRTDAEGVVNYEGTNALVATAFSISPAGSKNTGSYKIEYKLQSATAWTLLTNGTGFSYDKSIVTGAVFDANSSYDVRLTVTDYFGNITKMTELPTAFTLLDFNASGRGLAFGKVSEQEAIEFALPVISTLGHFISSPVILAGAQNMNDLTAPGYYVVGNTAISATITNKPPMTSTETAFIEVAAMGDGMQRLQRYYVCDKDDQYIWQRLLYSGTWGSWMLVGGCSGWKNLTIDSAFSAYSANTVPRYRVNGNVITVMGAVSPKEAFTSDSSKVVMVSGIPEYFRPTTPLAFVCQGSGMNRWSCGIETNGNITISRYGITGNTNVPATAWLIFNCTYSV